MIQFGESFEFVSRQTGLAIILLDCRPLQATLGRNCMKSIQKLSVCELSKLGACIAAIFAERGFEVFGVDIDPEKARKI
jgi:hypothetical protein